MNRMANSDFNVIRVMLCTVWIAVINPPTAFLTVTSVAIFFVTSEFSRWAFRGIEDGRIK